jgi:mono/diheme cytochrome c family protein
MTIRQLEGFMRTQIMVFAALVAMGGVFPAWGSPRAEPAQPAEEIQTPSMEEPRQQAIEPPVPSRGQLLYENHCMACHESVVHIRTQQQVQSLSALRAQVLRWTAYMQLRWGKEEVEDVVDYLGRQYYKFESR